MRRSCPVCIVVFSLVILLLAGCAVRAHPVAQASGEPVIRYGRPAPQEAGENTTAPSYPYEVRQVDEKWSMRDGATLPVYVYYPVPQYAGESFPMVVFVHPWDMDRSFYRKDARELAARGYVGVTYTVRGWFGADGEIGCIDPAHEMNDLSAIITRVAGDRRWMVRADAKGPVVGVTGYSMGGVHSYLIAPRLNPRPGDPGDPRVRAIVAQHGGFDLLASIYPNGCVKWAWASFLLLGVNNGSLFGAIVSVMFAIMDPDISLLSKFQAILNALLGIRPGNVTPDLMEIYDIAVNRRIEEEEQAKSFLKVRSARFWCDEEMDGVVEHPVTVPTLVITGWKDDLFTPDEGLCAVSSLLDAPGRIIITNAGHAGGFAVPFGDSGPIRKWTREQSDRWFDRFLKGEDNGVDREPFLSYYRGWSPGEFGSADAWPPAGVREEPYYLGAPSGAREGVLSTAPPEGRLQPDLLVNNGLCGSISLPYFDLTAGDGPVGIPFPERIRLPGLPLSTYGYVSEPLEAELTILGSPRVAVSYRSSHRFTQLIPVLYEIRPDGTEVPATRGWFEGRDERGGETFGADGQELSLTACCHRFSAGSRIRLDLQTADLLMAWPNWALSTVEILHGAEAQPFLVLPVMATEN